MYQKLYCMLFNAITDALEELGKPEGRQKAEEILVTAQQRAEERFLEEAGDD